MIIIEFFNHVGKKISHFFRVNVERLILGKTPIDRLLTTDTKQEINANVTIHGNVIVDGSDIEINHLETNKPIFGVNLQDLLDDSYFGAPDQNITVTTEKSFQNLTINELIIENDFWQNDQTTEEIENQIDVLSRGITIQGPITFESSFKINNLTVTETINGIPSARFGQEWLLYEGKQVRLKYLVLFLISF